MDTGMPITYPCTGGGICAYLRAVLLGGGIGNAPFRVIYVGGDPTYSKDPGWGGGVHHQLERHIVGATTLVTRKC